MVCGMGHRGSRSVNFLKPRSLASYIPSRIWWRHFNGEGADVETSLSFLLLREQVALFQYVLISARRKNIPKGIFNFTAF